jgi:hypothetical protein
MTALEDLGKRLERLPGVLSNRDFLASRGIGNEIGFHIFSYPPQLEPVVEGYISKLIIQLAARQLRVLELNLYRIILGLLEERGLLEKSFDLEAKKGSEGLEKALKKVVRPEKLVELMAAKLADPHDLLFLTGVGAAYPLVRSHTVLNNLHAVVKRVPLVMFFPGSYDGQELRLFNVLKDDNYYRAFPLLQERVR